MKFFSPVLFCVFLFACGEKEDTNPSDKYFDIKGYFGNEAIRLKEINPTIKKQVSHNNQSEEKELNLSDWTKELQLFAESDINKPAWKDSYTILKSSFETKYLAKDKSLKTKSISILQSAKGDILKISILNETSNALYSSKENLEYIPDSLYLIRKRQSVRVIGENTYTVSARFKN